jgi:cytochrome P450
MSAIGVFLPALPYPLVTYPGFSFPWTLKHKGLFGKLKCDTVSICGADGRAMLFTADVSFINYMTSYGSRDNFPKPVDEYKVLSYLGSNLVICEGESWRRQRRIGAPAFSKKMFERL